MHEVPNGSRTSAPEGFQSSDIIIEVADYAVPTARLSTFQRSLFIGDSLHLQGLLLSSNHLRRYRHALTDHMHPSFPVVSTAPVTRGCLNNQLRKRLNSILGNVGCRCTPIGQWVLTNYCNPTEFVNCNSEFTIRNSEFGIHEFRFANCNFEFTICNSEFANCNSEIAIRNFKFTIHKFANQLANRKFKLNYKSDI